MKVSLISNGSRTERFWQAMRDKLDSLILTFHLDVARKLDSDFSYFAIVKKPLRVGFGSALTPIAKRRLARCRKGCRSRTASKGKLRHPRGFMARENPNGTREIIRPNPHTPRSDLAGQVGSAHATIAQTNSLLPGLKQAICRLTESVRISCEALAYLFSKGQFFILGSVFIF
ncbi:hypothetical protein [Ruegeria sp. Ofav3-42]|uniref:hypothetical protein n=1 Tax=Ruegeria sp. Ofav3-42 TaxID=2917759 RepID=UPI001EF3DEFC|nr:hypothetical protein [Ruegeria sp. Ofav3-42]MCG7519809.1 hypothetical protein [Ruegeria sp. Ofav3-42]